ncbi:MAG TPA: substrate-binding domain-containing protein [Polyangia bacterium]|nr:substrate-binding domain-containing protein [Polyangia bacterium]
MRSSLPFLVAVGLAGCATHETPRDERPLIVAAPPSLKAPFDDVARAYQARHPGALVTISTAAPLELLTAGAPLDVIAAESSDALSPIAPRLTERRDFASNPLVLVERQGAPKVQARALGVTPWVQRIALGDGRADATGAAAEAALGRLGLRRELDARLMYTATTEQAIERVVDGRAELAFARASDLAGRDNLQIAERADAGESRYPIAIVAGTPRLAPARDFLDEVLHGEGPHAFSSRGLSPSAAP